MSILTVNSIQKSQNTNRLSHQGLSVFRPLSVHPSPTDTFTLKFSRSRAEQEAENAKLWIDSEMRKHTEAMEQLATDLADTPDPDKKGIQEKIKEEEQRHKDRLIDIPPSII